MSIISRIRNILRPDAPSFTGEEALTYVRAAEAKQGRLGEVVAYWFVREIDSDWVCKVHTLDNNGKRCWWVWRQRDGRIYGEC